MKPLPSHQKRLGEKASVKGRVDSVQRKKYERFTKTKRKERRFLRKGEVEGLQHTPFRNKDREGCENDIEKQRR